MRQISWSATLLLFGSWILSGYLAVKGSVFALGRLPLTDFRGAILTLGAIVIFYVCIIACYRLLLRVFPFEYGELAPGSKGEMAYNIHMLFQLYFFWPLLGGMLVPVPLNGLVYRGMGVKMGPRSFSGGYLADAPLIRIGDWSVVGGKAIIFAHAVEGNKLIVSPVVIGDRVTIGARAILMPGVTVGDGAVVGVGAVVQKNTKIGPNEVWSGSPARFVRKLGRSKAALPAPAGASAVTAPRTDREDVIVAQISS